MIMPTLSNPGRGLQALEVIATVAGVEVLVVAAAVELEADGALESLSAFSRIPATVTGKIYRLDRPRPNSIAGQARSKSDGTRLFNNSSESTSISISSASSRPSIISRSTSIGSSSLPQNRARTPSAGRAGSFFQHYR